MSVTWSKTMTTPETSSPVQSAELIAQMLLQIVPDVLKRAEVSSGEDLFATYGMQSLTALRVVVAMRARNIGLSIGDLYLHRTIDAVARHLASVSASAPRS
ncbi:hypothetical protein BSIN_5139 [Burkholderia singularis]|uniref:Carrier domain-containing protein n=2 Tax=Burkholderia singularis TaxID=1503053 RepID=A0A238HAG8_9BURK|nr:hypothetical protein BSIN_5139 [Burkholderia singularis]